MEDEKTKKCPYCGTEIPENAQKCRHCGEWIKEKPKNDNSVYMVIRGLAYIFIIILALMSGYSADQGTIDSFTAISAAIAFCITFEIYFIPTTIADKKCHTKTTQICMVNLFFGCTLIGWVIALIWALNDEH